MSLSLSELQSAIDRGEYTLKSGVGPGLAGFGDGSDTFAYYPTTVPGQMPGEINPGYVVQQAMTPGENEFIAPTYGQISQMREILPWNEFAGDPNWSATGHFMQFVGAMAIGAGALGAAGFGIEGAMIPSESIVTASPIGSAPAGFSPSSASFFNPTGPDLLKAFNPGSQMITETLAADIAAGTYAVPSVVPELVLAQSAVVSNSFTSSILDLLKDAKTAADGAKALGALTTPLGIGRKAANTSQAGLTVPGEGSSIGTGAAPSSGANSQVAQQTPSAYSQASETINLPVIVAGIGVIALLLYFRSKKHG